MMKKPVYLDYGATTPVDPRVVDKMIPYLYERFGNPASNSHAYGWDATAAVDEARSEVAKMIGADFYAADAAEAARIAGEVFGA